MEIGVVMPIANNILPSFVTLSALVTMHSRQQCFDLQGVFLYVGHRVLCHSVLQYQVLQTTTIGIVLKNKHTASTVLGINSQFQNGLN